MLGARGHTPAGRETVGVCAHAEAGGVGRCVHKETPVGVGVCE